jgi:hypothetical protein
MTRQLKTSRVFVPGGKYNRDRFYPLIRISGRWLEAHGFREGAALYVTETMDGLLVSPKPPAGAVLTPLDQIKQEFQALGIETERRVKPQRQGQPDLSEQVERIPFDLPVVVSETLADKIPPDQQKFFKLSRATRKEYQEY